MFWSANTVKVAACGAMFCLRQTRCTSAGDSAVTKFCLFTSILVIILPFLPGIVPKCILLELLPPLWLAYLLSNWSRPLAIVVPVAIHPTGFVMCVANMFKSNIGDPLQLRLLFVWLTSITTALKSETRRNPLCLTPFATIVVVSSLVG